MIMYTDTKLAIEEAYTAIEMASKSSNTGIKLFNVKPGAFGGSIFFITLCYTPKEKWPHGIFQNANYATFMIDKDGSIELATYSLYLNDASPSMDTRLPIKKFRKYKAKTIESGIAKILDWSSTVEQFYI